MKHLIHILILFLALAPTLTKAQDMRTRFATMPDSILPYMSTNNRLDLLDFYDNRMEAKIKNVYDEPVILDSLATDFLRLKLSDNITYELSLIPTSTTDSLIAEIFTFDGEATASSIAFRDSSWNKRTDILLPMPDIKSFFSSIPDSLQNRMAFVYDDLATLPIMSFHYDPQHQLFTFNLSLSQLDKRLKDLARPYYKPVTKGLEILRL